MPWTTSLIATLGLLFAFLGKGIPRMITAASRLQPAQAVKDRVFLTAGIAVLAAALTGLCLGLRLIGR